MGAGLIHQEKGFDLMVSYPEARTSVLTVSRVQDVFPNRVYESNFTVEELLDMWNRGVVLNTTYYVGRSYKSIHIGEARFTHRSGRQQIRTPPSFPKGRSVPSPARMITGLQAHNSGASEDLTCPKDRWSSLEANAQIFMILAIILPAARFSTGFMLLNNSCTGVTEK